MNPGTTLFIIIGIIGLLLYVSKALKPSMYENFQTLGPEDTSSKAKSALETLKSDTMNLETLMSAFSTPDFNNSTNSKPSSLGGPLNSAPSMPMRVKEPMLVEEPVPISMGPTAASAVPAMASAPTMAAAPALAATTTAPLNSLPIMQQQPSPPKVQATPPANTLPIMPPASIINMDSQPSEPPPMTISDSQGNFMKNKMPSPDLDDTMPGSRETKIVYVPRQCPPLPDMTQYIRKDSIPCWGCNLK